MALAIYVGKNVARILDREFPIDSDLSMVKYDRDTCGWTIDSAVRREIFTPIDDQGEVSADAFRTYHHALNKSIAFNHRGKMRKLFERKEEGVKIIPGHGVFILPAKMQVVQSGQRKVKIRVFNGTSLAKEFQSSDYHDMVNEAATHYFGNLREFTDEVNESLWYPVKYNRNYESTCDGLVIPDGVQVYPIDVDGYSVAVRFYSVKDGQSRYLATAKNHTELRRLVQQASEIRKAEQREEAMYRFVNPSFVQLSNYMRRHGVV